MTSLKPSSLRMNLSTILKMKESILLRTLRVADKTSLCATFALQYIFIILTSTFIAKKVSPPFILVILRFSHKLQGKLLRYLFLSFFMNE